MNISIRNLRGVNFKSIKDQTIEFGDETTISGDNATGKTTVFDMFTFLLFGKDSSDRKDFNIKPMDSNGKTSDKVDSEVSGTLEVNGVEMNLKRVYKEKWQKKKGEEVAEFVGNETLYYWNEVPLQQKEYVLKIETLVNEKVFKLITNPLYFNSLKWEERRSVLLSIAGNISDDEILATLNKKDEVLKLSSLLSQGKTLSETKKEISAKRKKAVDDLKLIPSRIDEANRSKPEADNFDVIRASIQRYTKEIEAIDEQIGDKAKANEGALKLIQEKQSQLYALKSELTAIEFNVKEEIRDRNRKQDEEPLKIRRDITSMESELANLESKIQSLKNKNVSLEASLQPGRDEWAKENSKELVFDESKFDCPACQRRYESDDVEAAMKTMTENFNSDKLKRLEAIRSKGIQTKAEIEENSVKIQQLESEKSGIEEKITVARNQFQKLTTAKADRKEEKVELNEILLSNSEYASLTVRIADLTANIEESQSGDKPQEDSGLKEEKSKISSRLAELNKTLGNEEQIARIDKRIEELKESERSLSQIIADYDGYEFAIDAFVKAKMNILESRINDKFKLARFKMFDTQINGGETETCDTTYNGVPWSDLNTAAKIQVGIDIINALSEFYNVTAPIWIDNRESTVSIPETHSQVINLVVRESDKVLRVQTRKLEYA